ncbi:MAG TPA: hypothetical protein VHG10_02595 [Glycomyces sp.]|nr:hypothetical protein [Glycomyces sp.]
MADLGLGLARLRSPRAVIELGKRRIVKGDFAGAARAFEKTAASGPGRHYNVRGALHLWIMHAGLGDMPAAKAAYRKAMRLWAPHDQTDLGDLSLGLGTGIVSTLREFIRPARSAFERAATSGDPEYVSLAAMGLAGLLLQEPEVTHERTDTDAIVAALRRAIDAGHPEFVPAAANWLAHTSSQTGDVAAARIALRAAIASGETDQGTHTALDVGMLFEREGLRTEAIAAMRFAFDNSRDGRAMIAARHLGSLLAEQGDTEGARAALQYALDHSESPRAIAEIEAAMRRL